MLNSFYGGFRMREDRKIAQFVCSDFELSKLLENTHYEITALIPQTESVCLVEYKNAAKETIEMSNNTNVYIASATTAWARMELYKYLDLCSFDQGSKSRAYYCDTDSIIYKASPNCEENLPEGRHLGDLTNELDHDEYISYFASAGPKNYCYRTTKGTECVKVKGFSLNAKNREVFSVENMRTLVQNYLIHNVDNNGRITLPSKAEKVCEDKLDRHDMMMEHVERGENAIFFPEVGMSCLNKRKITRSKDWRLINKEEQKMNKIYCDKRVSFFSGDTISYGFYFTTEPADHGVASS